MATCINCPLPYRANTQTNNNFVVIMKNAVFFTLIKRFSIFTNFRWFGDYQQSPNQSVFKRWFSSLTKFLAKSRYQNWTRSFIIRNDWPRNILQGLCCVTNCCNLVSVQLILDFYQRNGGIIVKSNNLNNKFTIKSLLSSFLLSKETQFLLSHDPFHSSRMHSSIYIRQWFFFICHQIPTRLIDGILKRKSLGLYLITTYL